MRKKFLISLVLLFMSMALFSSPSSSTTSDALMNQIFNNRAKEVEAAALAIVSTSVAVPKVMLPGVVPVANPISVFIPAGISFADSDVSKYPDVIAAPSKGLFSSFISKTMSSVNPISVKAGNEIKALNIQNGDMIISGNIDIEGADTVDIMAVIMTTDFSDIDMFIEGTLTLKGNYFPKPLNFSGKMEIIGGEDRQITLDTSGVKLNSAPLGLGKITFKVENF